MKQSVRLYRNLLLLFSVTTKLLSEPHVASLICGSDDNTFGTL